MTQPELVAVLNITPDSFSDGQAELTPDVILEKAQRLIEAGADVLDVGAESTRPGAIPLTPDEEQVRLEPVLPMLQSVCELHGVSLSIDTRHAKTAQWAIRSGVDWVNDVSGFQQEDMLKAVGDASCRLVAMHALSVPADSDIVLDEHIDAVDCMRQWCAEKVQQLEANVIARKRIILDPGIGFGKTAQQCWQLLARVHEWRPEGVPLLIGHSRKSFLSLIDDAPAAARDEVTRAVSAMLACAGVEYLRVHDVAGHRTLLDSVQA